jgi:hypothetical protein
VELLRPPETGGDPDYTFVAPPRPQRLRRGNEGPNVVSAFRGAWARFVDIESVVQF